MNADRKELRKLEKKIGKEHAKLAKTMAEYDESLSDKKRQKPDQEILEDSTEGIAMPDLAKARPIQLVSTILLTITRRFSRIVLVASESRSQLGGEQKCYVSRNRLYGIGICHESVWIGFVFANSHI